ncbi:MAG TPA: sigma 54-interacting transcriptional regulator [Kofleriaceae bacterium]|nr:sigma 54-interacting transcriptional regulator [Kofleriaceae bacterium]
MPAARSRATETMIMTLDGRAIGLRVQKLALEVESGPDAGARAELAGHELVVGADPSSTLVLRDPKVSRFHFRVIADDTGLLLRDRGSANGTFVGGLRVREVYLHDGARIEVGDSVIVAKVGGGEQDIELSPDESFGAAIGRSVAMRRLFAAARKAAQTSATVLLLGETGTGKDVLARAIHDASPRARAPYVVFDCGAVAPTLIESALFGHVRGAFTGADADRPGVFEWASGGTIFLDEIGELRMDLQPKLLRALETGAVTRVGATTPVPVDVRVIAATNRDLRADVEAQLFRADLYYRLAVIVLEVPPLRDRREDVPLLAGSFARELLGMSESDMHRLRAQLDEAFAALRHYPWPGNIRELRNVIERAVAMTDPQALRGDALARLVELRSTIASTWHARLPLEQARAEFDREYLRDVMAAAQHSIPHAAQLAGVHPKSLERLLRRYKLRGT